MQKELAASYPLLHIQLLGVNWFGLESANGDMVKDKSLPWLQDVDANGDRHSDLWHNWGTDHLDLVVLDGSNKLLTKSNLGGTGSLGVPANYAGLRDYLIGAAMVSQKPWQNPRNPHDVDNSGAVVPMDALVIINRINATGAQQLPPPVTGQSPPPYYDANGDGSLAALDGLLIINHLNAGSSTAGGEGESWMQRLAAKPASLNVSWSDGTSTGVRDSSRRHPGSTYTATSSAGVSGDNAPTASNQLIDVHSVGHWSVGPVPNDPPDVLGGDNRALTNRNLAARGGRVTRAKFDLAVDELMANEEGAAAWDSLLAESPLADAL